MHDSYPMSAHDRVPAVPQLDAEPAASAGRGIEQ
jgi:hypothetical protein